MNKQAGMTMVELITAIAITGVIVAFLGTAVYQIFSVSDYGNGRLTALHEMQNAAYWLNADGQGAVSATGGSQLVLTLADNSTITYSLSGSKLLRTYTGTSTTLASNMSSVSFTINSRVITATLTSSPAASNNVSETETYMVYLRPSGGS